MNKEQIVKKLRQIGNQKIEEMLQHNQEQFRDLSEKETIRDSMREVLRILAQDLNLEINAPARDLSLLPLGVDILEFYSNPENQNQKLPTNPFLKNLATAAKNAASMEATLPVGHKIFKEFTGILTNYIILDSGTFLALNCKEYFEKCQEAKKILDQEGDLKLSEMILSQSNLFHAHEKFYSFQSISRDLDVVRARYSEISSSSAILSSASHTNSRLEQMAEEIVASVQDIPGRNPQTSAFRELRSTQLTLGGK